MFLLRATILAWPLSLACLAACGGDSDGGSGGPSEPPGGGGVPPTDIAGGATGIPANTASLQVLADNLNFATAVAVRDNSAWVAEGQLDHLLSPAQNGPPGPFRILGVNLNGGLNQQVISFLSPRPNLYPEGITAAADGTLYFGSVGERLIFSVAPGSIEPGGFLVDGSVFVRGVVGLDVDEPRNLVWACDSHRSVGGATALVGLSRADGSVQARHDMPENRFCGAVRVDSTGALLVTESASGRIYRSPPEAALTSGTLEEFGAPYEELRPVGGFSPKGIEILGGGVVILSNNQAGELYRLDQSGVELVQATLDGQPYAFNRPDGLARLAERELLVVENGDGEEAPSRLVKVTFDER